MILFKFKHEKERKMTITEINKLLSGYDCATMTDTGIRCPFVDVETGKTCMSTMKSFTTFSAVCNKGHSASPPHFLWYLTKTVSPLATETILKDAYNLTDATGTTTSELKCLKCGKRAYVLKMEVVCTGDATHNLENREYITRMADMYEGLTRANENTPILIDKPIL